VRENGRLLGLFPLLARRHWYRPGIPFRRLEACASGEDEQDETCSEYLGPIVERGEEPRVARLLGEALARGRLGAWDELVIPEMDGSLPLASLLAAELSRHGVHAATIPTGLAPYIPLPATWEAYLAALPSRSRYLVNRSLRDFQGFARGTERLEWVRSEAELGAGQRILYTLHADRWGADGASGMFASPRFRSFHDAVARALVATGGIDLVWLTVGGEPIAALYNFLWNRKLYYYQGGRKQGLPKGIRPGIVIHALAIQRAIAAGLREYDFMSGASQYKRQLALSTRPMVKLRATRAHVRETARRLCELGIARARTLGERFLPPPRPRGNDSPGSHWQGD
jgi:hypothetical protein